MLENIVDKLVAAGDHFVFNNGAHSKKPAVTFGY
jgi:hypothetical protein